MKTAWIVGLVAAMLMLAMSESLAEQPYGISWSKQLGTWAYDMSFSVTADGLENSFLGGFTEEDLGGTNAGGADAFLASYNGSGTLRWSAQLGTTYNEYGNAVAADASGNAFLSGSTGGDLFGTNAGLSDAFLVKYNSVGTILWSRQFGTSNYDEGMSIAVDSLGNAFIAGGTDGGMIGQNAGSTDAFLTKFDGSGNRLWTKQLGTASYDAGMSVAVDKSGNAIMAGHTTGNMVGSNAGHFDIFLAKYDGTGNFLWKKQLGTNGDDECYSVAVDKSGNIFLGGFTDGDLGGPNSGFTDAFLAKFDSSGNLIWSRQLGTATTDYGFSVTTDDSGHVFLCGVTAGDLGGSSAGGDDLFLAKFDGSGNPVWLLQTGTETDDDGLSVTVDSSGDVFVSGYTWGSLGGPSADGVDIFLVKFTPEPATLALLAMGGVVVIWRRRR